MKNNQGFTLMELMITTAIIGILAAIAIGNYMASRPQRQLQSAARELYSGMQKCKITAAKEHTRCAISFGESDGADTWDYLIYLDANNPLDPTDRFTYTAGERVLASGMWSDYPYVSLNAAPTFPANSSGNPTIAFRSTGLPVAPAAPNGTVGLTNTKNDVRQLVISRAGNIRLN